MEFKKRMYRKWDLDVPREEIRAMAERCAGDPSAYNKSTLSGPYIPADSADWNGQTLVFRGEGRVFRFEILSENELLFSEGDGEPISCWCQIKTMEGVFYFLNHLAPGGDCTRQISLIFDRETGCATLCDAHIGTEFCSFDVEREFLFGRLDGDFAGGPLHGFTNDLIGKAIAWDYGPQTRVTPKHMYTSNLYYSYSVSTANGAWMASNPANYVKLRDNYYLVSFLEERQTGIQALLLVNLDTLHDIGTFYGVSGDHIVSAFVAAIGTPGEPYTIF